MDILLNSFSGVASSFAQTGHIMSYTWYFVLPPLFYAFFKPLWIYHIQLAYWLSFEFVLLELIPPKDIEKSPKPMEALFVGMAGVEKTFNPVERFILGQFPDSFSVELVSTEGSVHMYIRTQKKYRHLIEAHLYAQYPNLEILEVPDYVNDVPKVIPNAQWDLWGTDLEFTKKEPVFPIRTYKHFEEDVTGKMIDPLAGLIETMGKLGPGQHLWFQISFFCMSPGAWVEQGKAATEKMKGREVKKENIFERIWNDIMDIITNIPKAIHSPVEFAAATKKEEQPLDMRLSPGEREVLKEMEEKTMKLAFKGKARFVYLGRRENFDKALGVSAFMGGIKQFGNENMNGLKPNDTAKTYANYIFKESRLRYRQRKILRRYRNRQNDTGAQVIFNTEELATLFHIPDMNVMAPALPRVDARRGGAPSNLPVE